MTLKVDKKKIFWKKVGDQVVILNAESGDYYTLDQVSVRIWEMVVSGHDEDNIVDKVIQEYKITKKEADKDVKNFLKSLREENLVHLK